LKANRVLAGILALILVAGLGTPAFAEGIEETFVDPPEGFSASVFIDTAEFDDIIFDSGGAPSFSGGPFIGINFGFKWTTAQNFALDEDNFVTDFHFVLDEFGDPLDTDIQHFIFADDEDKPGEILASGFSQNLEREPIDDTFAEIWFDLEEPFLAEAGVKYWFGITTDKEPSFAYSWDRSSIAEGNSCLTNVFPPEFDVCDNTPTWFLLSGHPPDVVGGEFLPIDSTALLLAGAQTFSWMIPLVLSGIGIGLFVVSRKSE